MIAKKALAKETGARGLRSIMEDILTEAMFEVDLFFDFAMPVGNPISAWLIALWSSRCRFLMVDTGKRRLLLFLLTKSL
jgi:hypothetical protein